MKEERKSKWQTMSEHRKWIPPFAPLKVGRTENDITKFPIPDDYVLPKNPKDDEKRSVPKKLLDTKRKMWAKLVEAFLFACAVEARVVISRVDVHARPHSYAAVQPNAHAIADGLRREGL